MKNKKIVVIGGGKGIFNVLSGLKKYPVHLSAIVSTTDNGGSSGILRKELGVLPPGDVRRALLALADSKKTILDLFNFRFSEGKLSGHNFGNLFISALEKITGSLEKSIEITGNTLGVKGEVIPVTLQKTDLFAVLETGRIIKGETDIDIPKHNPCLKIKRVYLKPRIKANEKAVRAIKKADLIVIGPGDLYTSLIPNLLVEGIPQAVRKSRAKKVYICSLMTKPGETNGFKSSEFVEKMERYLGKDVLNFVVLNDKKPLPARIRKYEKKGAEFVQPDKNNFQGKKLKIISADFLETQGLIQHRADKLAETLIKL